MVDFTARQGLGPQSRAFHYSYEKAGLVLDNQPIPWNADAVLVEVLLLPPGNRRPAGRNAAQGQPTGYLREDFVLRLVGNSQEVTAESIKQAAGPDPCRVFFRFPVPLQNASAEILWRGHSRGQLQLPVLQAEDFLRHLSLQMSSLSAQLDHRTVSCQAAVASQCHHVVVSAPLSSATSLAPILDMGLCVRMLSQEGDTGWEEPVHLSHSQLKTRQALLAVIAPKPRRAGTWRFQWVLDGTILAEQLFKTTTGTILQNSLRVSATRYVVQYADGRLALTKTLPALDGVERVGPCFWVASSVAGLAGWCELEVHAQRESASKRKSADSLHHREKVLLTDGPTTVIPGTLDLAELKGVKHFELRCRSRLLGLLPVASLPTSTFTGEGGFEPVEEFAWSPAAEEQLQEKLGRLFGGK